MPSVDHEPTGRISEALIGVSHSSNCNERVFVSLSNREQLALIVTVVSESVLQKLRTQFAKATGLFVQIEF